VTPSNLPQNISPVVSPKSFAILILMDIGKSLLEKTRLRLLRKLFRAAAPTREHIYRRFCDVRAPFMSES
jgi:hypothetical protein